MVDDNQQQQNALPQLAISVESTEKSPPPKSPSPVVEMIQPQRSTPARKAPSPKPAQPKPERIRDKEIIIIEREGGNVTKNININIESALDEGNARLHYIK